MKESPNLSYIDKLANGDELFADNLMNIIRKELPTEIKTYRLHLENEEFLKTVDAVHKLSHKISILGLENGYKVAKTFETDLLQKNLRLRPDFDHILETMLHFIEKA